MKINCNYDQHCLYSVNHTSLLALIIEIIKKLLTTKMRTKEELKNFFNINHEMKSL